MEINDGRVSRRTFPTAAFTLTVSLITWISQEAARRGVSKSVVVREILEAARVESEAQEAAA